MPEAATVALDANLHIAMLLSRRYRLDLRTINHNHGSCKMFKVSFRNICWRKQHFSGTFVGGNNTSQEHLLEETTLLRNICWRKQHFSGTFVGGNNTSQEHLLEETTLLRNICWRKQHFSGTFVGGNNTSQEHLLEETTLLRNICWRKQHFSGTFVGGNNTSQEHLLEETTLLRYISRNSENKTSSIWSNKDGSDRPWRRASVNDLLRLIQPNHFINYRLT